MSDQRPPLPTRTPANRAIAATLRLWQDTWSSDVALLERVAAGLRGLPDEHARNLPTPNTAPREPHLNTEYTVPHVTAPGQHGCLTTTGQGND